MFRGKRRFVEADALVAATTNFSAAWLIDGLTPSVPIVLS